jgi:hypothetical protein
VRRESTTPAFVHRPGGSSEAAALYAFYWAFLLLMHVLEIRNASFNSMNGIARPEL